MTKEEIIAVVKRLYSRLSYEEISTTQIIAACNISRGSLYWHFSSKEAIFQAVFDSCYTTLVETTRKDQDESKSALYNLKNRLINMIALDRRDPDCAPIVRKHIARILMPDSMDPFPYGAFHEDIDHWIEKGIANKELYPYPGSFLAPLIVTLDWEIVTFLRKNPTHYDDVAFTENLINKVFRSIQA
ncbi:MAG: TetR/AcrR family transcriptional regulator [Spirochaetaceae bacterium]|jgi:AcrR family transcriptional regulator|nr:TetR/AcrR family transcriptional regulator [Spirochaetaceae bacterium]